MAPGLMPHAHRRCLHRRDRRTNRPSAPPSGPLRRTPAECHAGARQPCRRGHSDLLSEITKGFYSGYCGSPSRCSLLFRTRRGWLQHGHPRYELKKISKSRFAPETPVRGCGNVNTAQKSLGKKIAKLSSIGQPVAPAPFPIVPIARPRNGVPERSDRTRSTVPVSLGQRTGAMVDG